MADPEGPFAYRNNDSTNSILRKILNWWAAVGSGVRSIAVNIIGTVSSAAYVASATDTRPANVLTYTAGDVVGNDTPAVLTFPAMGPAVAGSIVLTNVRLELDSAAIPAGMTYFRLHLYSSAPTAIADGAAYSLVTGDRDKYLGPVDLPPVQDFGDTLFADCEAFNYSIRREMALASSTIYGILETLNSYTPLSGTVLKFKLNAIGV